MSRFINLLFKTNGKDDDDYCDGSGGNNNHISVVHLYMFKDYPKTGLCTYNLSWAGRWMKNMQGFCAPLLW